MPPLFWLDAAFLILSALITTSLLLMVLGLGPGRALNRAFALFALLQVAWIVSALLLRLSLWLGPALPAGGLLANSLLWLELIALFISLLPNSALGFTARYLGRRTRWTDVGQGLGLLLVAALSIPLFRHQLIFNPRLDAQGLVAEDINAWGLLAAALVFTYLLWSLILFWQERRHKQSLCLASSMLILLLGIVGGGILDAPFPLLSITNCLSAAILAYGVLRLQLFNPLLERTAELQREVAERKKAENQLQERLQFERLIAKLSARFVNVEADQIDSEIKAALATIGPSFDLDRIGLWTLSADQKYYRISHSWAVEGTEDIQATLSTDSFPYIKHRLLSEGEPFMFSAVEDLPEEAVVEKRYYDDQGIKSSAVLPLTVAGERIGALSVSTLRQAHDWPADMVQRLFLLGEVLSNAMVRQRMHQKLMASEGRLFTFINSASDSFYLLDANLDFVDVNRRALEIIGMPRDSVIGKNIVDIVPDVKVSGRYEKHLEVMRTGVPFVVEDFVPHPVFGDLHFVLTSFKVGEGLGVIASDITERKRAEEALRLYADRLEILHDIDRGILAAQSPEAIARAAVTQVRRLIPCQRAGVALFKQETNDLLLLAVDTPQTQLRAGVRLPLDQFQDLVRSLQEGQIVTWEDLAAQGPVGSMVRDEGLRAMVSVPLISRGELIGALNLGLADPDRFGPEHEAIAGQVADQLAIAIQQARLHDQVQRFAQELERRVADRTRELSALFEVMAVASEPLDLETTLGRSLEQVLEAVEGGAGLIYLLAEDERILHLAVQRGIPPDLLPELESLPSDLEMARRLIEYGEPHVMSDITADPPLAIASRVSPRIYVGVPMRASGRVLGILTVLRQTTQPQFAEEEIALLTSIADQIGVVVERVRLRQRAERVAVLEERQRLARDLHDSVTQSLYSLTLLTETGRRSAQAGDLEGVANYLARSGEVAQQALKEMRLLIYELRPPELERDGLLGALQQRLDAVEGRAGVEARLLLEGEIRVAPPVEEALYRIALEALNNALKHASATSVQVWIRANGERVSLEIVDNGRGFDPLAVRDKGGMGLAIMHERARQSGGALAILSRPGGGTTVKVTVNGQ